VDHIIRSNPGIKAGPGLFWEPDFQLHIGVLRENGTTALNRISKPRGLPPNGSPSSHHNASVKGSNEDHLSQIELKEAEGVDCQLDVFANWTKYAEFGEKRADGIQRCVDQGKYEAWGQLVTTIRHEVKVFSTAKNPC
jgi:hypothetical protein